MESCEGGAPSLSLPLESCEGGAPSSSAASSAGVPPRSVAFVHRGSHASDEGAVPPALQEVLANMHKVLMEAVPIADALEYLQSRRKNSRLCLATLLQKLVVKADTRARHASQADHVTSHLTGLSVFTVRKFARRGADERGRVCVTIPRGVGGRPRGREEAEVEGVAVELPSLHDDLAAFEADCDLPSVINVASGVAPAALAAVDPSADRASVQAIGLRLGSLAACPCHS